MNIAVNTRVLLSHRMEGVSRYIYETTKRIVKLNPQHHFYFLFDRSYDPKFVFEENVNPLIISPPTRHPFLWHCWFEHRLPKVFKKYKIDVFLSPDNFLSLSTDIPTVLVSHDLAYEHFPEQLRFGTKWFYKKNGIRFHQRANKIVAVSQSTKDDIVKTFAIDENKIVVGHNSAPDGFSTITPTEKQQQLDKWTAGQPYFIYVGSIHPRKNIVNLLKAFDHFKESDQSNQQLILVGRKAWKNDKLSSAFDNMKFKDQVQFHENIPDVRPMMAAATAMVYVSSFEGFGIPILEAFHSSIPVITSNISSMPEVAGDAALLVDPFDPRSIAAAMGKITTDSATAESLIRLGNERKDFFSWDKTSKIISDELNKLAS